jgi:hypothetical protein
MGDGAYLRRRTRRFNSSPLFLRSLVSRLVSPLASRATFCVAGARLFSRPGMMAYEEYLNIHEIFTWGLTALTTLTKNQVSLSIALLCHFSFILEYCRSSTDPNGDRTCDQQTSYLPSRLSRHGRPCPVSSVLRYSSSYLTPSVSLPSLWVSVPSSGQPARWVFLPRFIGTAKASRKPYSPGKCR